MTNQYIVVGVGKFGKHLIERLVEEGSEVVAIDTDPALIGLVKDIATLAVVMDATDPEAFRELGLPMTEIEGAIVTMADSVEASILATLVLKELGVKEVLGRATSVAHRRALLKVGADSVVFPEFDMADRVAKAILERNLVDYVEISSSLGIATVRARPEWSGQTLLALDFRRRHGAIVLAIKRRELPEGTAGHDEALAADEVATRYGEVIDLPAAEQILRAGDMLVIVGPEQRLIDLARTDLPQ